MRNVYIIGVDTLRFGKYMNQDHRELVEQTLEGVFRDAGVSRQDIQSVHFANCLWGYFNGQHGVRGHVAMRYCGLPEIPVTNLEAAWSKILTFKIIHHLPVKDIR